MRAGKQTAICAHAINTAVLVQPHLGEHVPEELVVHNPEGGARSIDEACNCCIHISLGHCPFAGVHCQLCTQLNGHLLLLLRQLDRNTASMSAASEAAASTQLKMDSRGLGSPSRGLWGAWGCKLH